MSSVVSTCFDDGGEMCIQSTQLYRGSGANYHNNSQRNVSYIARDPDMDRLEMEFLPDDSAPPSHAASRPVVPKQAKSKPAPVPVPAKF